MGCLLCRLVLTCCMGGGEGRGSCVHAVVREEERGLPCCTSKPCALQLDWIRYEAV